jgi:hypothetical protein
MIYFAKLNQKNTVIFVTVGREEDDGKEQELSEKTGETYKQTSINTRGGIYYDPETNEPAQDQGLAFRKNYAGIGYTYDATLDAFIPPKPYASWLLDENTCLWNAPVPYPEDGKMYSWDENTLSWVEDD